MQLNTYAGRVCVENPFTSLAQLIEDAANVHRKQRQESEAVSFTDAHSRRLPS
jgi:hypothetical protein